MLDKNSKKKRSIWKRLTGDKEEVIQSEDGQDNKVGAGEVMTQTIQAIDIDRHSEDKPEAGSQNEEWLEGEGYEGQLSVDVYQTSESVVIKSTIAGVRPEDIDISIQNDMITIRGQRQKEEEVEEENYFYQECYWGGFSRSIILPIEVRTDKIDAVLKDGVLTITLPKVKKSKAITIRVKKDE